jgi:hypothetical protein
MPRISVKLAGDRAHMLVQDRDAIACGMTLEEAENFLTFVRVSSRKFSSGNPAKPFICSEDKSHLTTTSL